MSNTNNWPVLASFMPWGHCKWVWPEQKVKVANTKEQASPIDGETFLIFGAL